MTELQTLIQTIESRWDGVYEHVSETPALWTQHYSHLTAEQVDLMVSAVLKMFDRTRPPNRYRIGFEVAQASAFAAASSLNSHLDQLVAQNYGHIPSFVAQLNQMLGATLAIVLTSNFSDDDNIIADTAIQVAEHAATAERDLESIQSVSQTLTDWSTQIQRRESEIAELEDRYLTVINKLDVAEATIAATDSTVNDLTALKNSTEELTTQLKNEITSASQLGRTLEQHGMSLDAAVHHVSETQERIDGLMPAAASTGLAAAFEQRANELKVPRMFWALVFLVSLGAAAFVTKQVDFSDDLYLESLGRLISVAPLVWLGWFSAVQYGNTNRLEEDYRFKSSTANAFVGYRDHMEHMKEIDLENAENALALLSSRTVEVLANEPGRVLGKPAREASPVSEVVNRWRPHRESDTDAGVESE